MGTLADKLIYLGATKTDLRESINTILGTTLDETTPFRQYGARAELKAIQSMSGIGPVFITDQFAPGTSTPLLYADSAGVTPASVGSVAGLLLDVSKGLALGPELVTNGDGEGGAIGAATYKIALSQSSDKAKTGSYSTKVTQTEDATNGYFYHSRASLGLALGDLCLVTADVFIPTGSTYQTVSLGNAGGGGTSTAATTKTNEWVSLRRYVYVDYANTAGVVCSSSSTITTGDYFFVDNYSIKKVLGTHALQSTTANKSTLRVTPSTGIRWLDANTATAAMTVTLPSAITNATTFVATPTGVVKTTGVNLGTSFSITSPYQWFSGYVAIDAAVHGATTPAEDALITRFLSRYVPALGSERLTNGAFDSGLTGWTVAGTDATHSVTADAGRVRMQGDTISPITYIYQNNAFVVGISYYLSFDVADVTAGALKFEPLTTVASMSSPGLYTRSWTQAGTTQFVIYRAAATFDVTLESVSAKQIL